MVTGGSGVNGARAWARGLWVVSAAVVAAVWVMGIIGAAAGGDDDGSPGRGGGSAAGREKGGGGPQSPGAAPSRGSGSTGPSGGERLTFRKGSLKAVREDSGRLVLEVQILTGRADGTRQRAARDTAVQFRLVSSADGPADPGCADITGRTGTARCTPVEPLKGRPERYGVTVLAGPGLASVTSAELASILPEDTSAPGEKKNP